MKTIWLCLIATSLAACSLLDIADQTRTVDTAASVAGTVERNVDVDGAIYVQFFVKRGLEVIHTGQTPLRADGSFFLASYPGELFLIAYIDTNGNQAYDAGEPVADTRGDDNQSTFIRLEPGQALGDQHIVIAGTAVVQLDNVDTVRTTRVNENLGRVVSLDDPLFSRANADMGLWRPLDFIYQFGGGLMFLQPYEKNKIPVIFIHGIGGTPVEFKAAIDALDRSRYQPWVLYYSSGFRLDAISDYMMSAMDHLQAEYHFSEVFIVAHSMGGLMSRSFLMKHEAGKSHYAIGKYVTINSPLYGIDSAGAWLDVTPVVVPSWRDVASNSEYIQRVHQWRVPKTIQYHLVFSYLKGKDGDGVVPMTSQLSLSLQREATKIYGFNAQHAEILRDPEFITQLNQILAP